MSSNDVMFMERPLATLLAPNILTGVLLRGDTRDMSYSLGFFGNGVDEEDRRRIDGKSVTARVTGAPIRKRRKILHFGVSAEYRNADSDEDARFRVRPESAVTDRRLVDTRTLEDVEDVLALGTEFAWAWKPVLVQAEYFATRVGRGTGPDVELDGWYASASYVLNGRQRPYFRHIGSFGEVDPRGRWGALELALRYGTLDLTDGDVTGGEETNLAAGINWYWNRNCRLMLEYLDIDADPNRDGVAESPSAWQARLQLGF
jgi:phosphate-selective porin OprO/OprP